MSTQEQLKEAMDATLPALREKMVQDLRNAYLRGQIEAACFLRDSFASANEDAAKIVCSNYACLTLVGAKLATFEDLQKQDRELIDFVPK